MRWTVLLSAGQQLQIQIPTFCKQSRKPLKCRASFDAYRFFKSRTPTARYRIIKNRIVESSTTNTWGQQGQFISSHPPTHSDTLYSVHRDTHPNRRECKIRNRSAHLSRPLDSQPFPRKSHLHKREPTATSQVSPDNYQDGRGLPRRVCWSHLVTRRQHIPTLSTQDTDRPSLQYLTGLSYFFSSGCWWTVEPVLWYLVSLPSSWYLGPGNGAIRQQIGRRTCWLVVFVSCICICKIIYLFLFDYIHFLFVSPSHRCQKVT